jgi:hypothetical protein
MSRAPIPSLLARRTSRAARIFAHEVTMQLKMYLSLILRSDNTIMRSDYPSRNQHPINHRRLATISPDASRRLPRIFLNCILGVTALHMAARNPGSFRISQLALKTKVCVFEGMSNAFQQAQHQRADVLYACITLMFVMEVRMSHVRLESAPQILLARSPPLTLR